MFTSKFTDQIYSDLHFNQSMPDLKFWFSSCMQDFNIHISVTNYLNYILYVTLTQSDV